MNDLRDVSKVVGTKQTLKALKEGRVSQVILAEDTDDKLKMDIKNTCCHYQVTVLHYKSKLELGKAVGIDRSAAVVAILK